jgi:cellulose synthase/poly-beta-1,6-N-acetylglucosamine synthase-like glycosyltransferase
MIAPLVFWFSGLTLVLVYAGYPCLLWLTACVRLRRVAKKDFLPNVSILIAAHNEERHIGATLANKVGLDYPNQLTEVIVVSDGSTDRTEDIVRDYASNGVRLIVQKERQGKTAALNRAVPEARGEILVFSDANSIYAGDALKKIVRNFADPSVGYVTGRMVYVDEKGSLIGDGCSAYMRYENFLRKLETVVGSIVGVDGGVDAVRKRLYRCMRPDQLPDLVLPLSVIEEGYRVVYEEEALLKEQTLTEVRDELKMRVRVILRAFHALSDKRGLFNPFLAGLFSVQLFVHKLLRYMAGFLQVLLFAASASLASSHPGYLAAFIIQILFYVAALAGRNRAFTAFPVFNYACYLCLLNGAAMLAFFKFLMGQKQIVWEPRKG